MYFQLSTALLAFACLCGIAITLGLAVSAPAAKSSRARWASRLSLGSVFIWAATCVQRETRLEATDQPYHLTNGADAVYEAWVCTGPMLLAAAWGLAATVAMVVQLRRERTLGGISIALGVLALASLTAVAMATVDAIAHFD